MIPTLQTLKMRFSVDNSTNDRGAFATFNVSFSVDCVGAKPVAASRVHVRMKMRAAKTPDTNT